MTTIIDCTLRDGGYYGNWDFDEDVVRKYLAATATAKIDIVEIGFRSLPQSRFLGAFAYSTDEYLNGLPLPEGVPIAVMVNAKEFVNYNRGVEHAVELLFNDAKQSPVEIVRIAAHAKEISTTQSIATLLHGLGYRVMINIMQVDSLSESDVLDVAENISSWGCVEVVYFADSLGNMDGESVASIAKTLMTKWDGPVGLHTHDNKGQALSNCVSALKAGVTYLDGTLLGMGRGAGNVKTECLLVELTEKGYGEYFPDALFPLVLQEFKALHEKYGWGANIYYFLSAVHGIHPTYIQELLGDDRYGTENILAAINFLKSGRAPFYSFENMLRAISGMVGSEYGDWSAKNWAKERDVLIIGAGPGTRQYINALQQYVERNKPVVLCLNINKAVPENMVTAYIACHETRILIESDHYPRLNKPLIIPMSRVPDGLKDVLNDVHILDYGLRVHEKSFELGEKGCVLSSPLAIAYAISVATIGGAKKILIAGMDGYDSSDPRQKEMVNMLNKYSKLKEALPIVAITPTTYPVQQRSVFEPNV